MPFEVKVDSAKLIEQFENMQKRVTELDRELPHVFLEWQREDMNRKYPKVDEQAGLSVTTYVYPRSRRKRTNRTNTGKATKGKQRRIVARPGTSTRPILREELVEQLFDRMKAMCKEAIEWQ